MSSNNILTHTGCGLSRHTTAQADDYLDRSQYPNEIEMKAVLRDKAYVFRRRFSDEAYVNSLPEVYKKKYRSSGRVELGGKEYRYAVLDPSARSDLRNSETLSVSCLLEFRTRQLIELLAFLKAQNNEDLQARIREIEGSVAYLTTEPQQEQS